MFLHIPTLIQEGDVYQESETFSPSTSLCKNCGIQLTSKSWTRDLTTTLCDSCSINRLVRYILCVSVCPNFVWDLPLTPGKVCVDAQYNKKLFKNIFDFHKFWKSRKIKFYIRNFFCFIGEKMQKNAWRNN